MPDINKVELLQKHLEMRVKMLERTVENLKNADRADDSKARFSVLDKQVAVLMASTLTKADVKLLEDASSAKQAAREAKINREWSEAQKASEAYEAANRKEMKALARNADLFSLNNKSNNRFNAIEERLLLLEALVKKLDRASKE